MNEDIFGPTMAKSIYGLPMDKKTYGSPKAKNIYGPTMAKNIYGPLMVRNNFRSHYSQIPEIIEIFPRNLLFFIISLLNVKRCTLEH